MDTANGAARKPRRPVRQAARAPTDDPDAQWLDIGKIGRPHGVRGALHVQPYHPQSELWQAGGWLRAHKPGAPARMVQIGEARPVQGGLVIAFAGVGDREAATLLTHAILQTDARDLPPADDDEVYLHELAGAEVIDADSGACVGTVAGFVETAQVLLQIRLADGKEALVPINCDAVVELGRQKGRVVVRDVRDWQTS